MRNIKVKIIKEENKIKVIYLDGKTIVAADTKFVNRCMMCKKATISYNDLGEKHICGDCLELVKKAVGTETIVKEKKSVEGKKSLNTIAKGYGAKIKLVNYVEYKNLMSCRVTEEIATMIVDLIIQGYNTPNKIAKYVGYSNVETVYTYMAAMSRVAMIYPEIIKNSKEKRIYKLNRLLAYTRV